MALEEAPPILDLTLGKSIEDKAWGPESGGAESISLKGYGNVKQLERIHLNIKTTTGIESPSRINES